MTLAADCVILRPAFHDSAALHAVLHERQGLADPGGAAQHARRTGTSVLHPHMPAASTHRQEPSVAAHCQPSAALQRLQMAAQPDLEQEKRDQMDAVLFVRRVGLEPSTSRLALTWRCAPRRRKRRGRCRPTGLRSASASKSPASSGVRCSECDGILILVLAYFLLRPRVVCELCCALC